MSAESDPYREDRVSLLEHFSGKTTAQATNLLSEAFVATSISALVQLFPASIHKLILVPTLSLLLAISMRTAYRIVYYGRLSSRVLNAKPDDSKRQGKTRIYHLYEKVVDTVQAEKGWCGIQWFHNWKNSTTQVTIYTHPVETNCN
jgi:hypothetical protein